MRLKVPAHRRALIPMAFGDVCAGITPAWFEAHAGVARNRTQAQPVQSAGLRMQQSTGTLP